MSYTIKEKKNKYIWKGDEVKIVFSDASFQANDDYAYSTSINDALYLYYNVKIYAKNLCWLSRKKRKEWIKISEKSTHDFPSILDLQYILDEMLNHKIPLENYRKVKYYHSGEELEGMIGYEYHFSTGSFCDDDYSVTQTIIKEDDKEDKEWYELYIGNTIDFQCGNNSVGVKCKTSKKDMELLLKLINDFLNNIVEKHNQETKENIINSINSFYCDDNVLFQKEINEPINSMFLVGDKINEIIVLQGSVENNDYFSREYHDCIIKEIKKNSFIIESKYMKEEKNGNFKSLNDDVEISYNKLLYVYDLIEDERLSFNEQEIVDNFIKICTSTIKNDFINESEDVLYNKYRDLMVDRYWMCRQEHNFEKRAEETGYHKNTYEAVKVVIKMIKDLGVSQHMGW